MRVVFNFEWGTKFTQGQVDKLNEIIEGTTKLQLEPPTDSNGVDALLQGHALKSYYDTYTADLLDVYEIAPGIKLNVHGVAATASFNRLMIKLSSVEQLLTVAHEQLYNQKCEVHVPGLGLLAIEETIVEEDCCTHKLNRLLSEGWRIIAACPQPDQRRPDYVLGRTRCG